MGGGGHVPPPAPFSYVLGVISILELRILKIHGFPHFTCFDILSCNIELKMCILLSFKFECHQFSSFCRSYVPFGTYTILEIQFSAFSSFMLWHIELKFCFWLSFYELQIKFRYRQFASIFVRVMPLLELKYWKYTVFRTFLLHALPHFAELLYVTLFLWILY